ncbi:methyltransferase domain-containing protein [Pelagibacterium xiamenense]|uniref:methyltransferase domain-containing protein n=1 Tax=Pelagibacterium xiamenense TaxID=2901140 RepID=UPI001E5E8482|nr:methyltransferase domain-containing protein [Pelagibacterium xiamenense]MCD7061408.1 class I SAM-dependent methyltransferase [Pelagibacterium xiamenense]
MNDSTKGEGTHLIAKLRRWARDVRANAKTAALQAQKCSESLRALEARLVETNVIVSRQSSKLEYATDRVDYIANRIDNRRSNSSSPIATHDEMSSAITSVWNDYDDEEYRKDQSHYRGVGRWADDKAWQEIGQASRRRIEIIRRILDRSELHDINVLEWGPGGGANLFAFRDIASRYYGIDISQKNLDESTRMIKEAGRSEIFNPVLLEGHPESIRDAVPHKIDVFLTTSVFQHFPSQQYGLDVLKTIRAVASDDAFGFIHIRFDDGREKFKGIEHIRDYKKRHITANSYPLEEFWGHLSNAGFTPLAVCDIRAANNSAVFYARCAPVS